MEFGVVYLLGKYVKLQETFFKRVYIPYLNIPNSLLLVEKDVLFSFSSTVRCGLNYNPILFP